MRETVLWQGSTATIYLAPLDDLLQDLSSFVWCDRGNAPDFDQTAPLSTILLHGGALLSCSHVLAF